MALAPKKVVEVGKYQTVNIRVRSGFRGSTAIRTVRGEWRDADTLKEWEITEIVQLKLNNQKPKRKRKVIGGHSAMQETQSPE